MPVENWVDVFSTSLFRNRLQPDFLENGEKYLEEYHHALREVGKNSGYWQMPFIAKLDEIRMTRYRVVGNYTRFDEAVLNELKDARHRIANGILHPGKKKRENHLIWAAPGSGKTYFVEQIAAQLKDTCLYQEINLAKQTEQSFRAALDMLAASHQPTICLVDEVDALPDAPWPYEILLPYMDAALNGEFQAVFVLAGSSGFSKEGMKQRISMRPKGTDMLSRVPAENEIIIAPLSFGDRILVVLSQFLNVGRRTGREITSVEKLGLYFVVSNAKLTSARQIYEFAVRAIERVPPDEDRIKYDHLFAPGDPENKRFWLEVSAAAKDLTNHFVRLEQ